MKKTSSFSNSPFFRVPGPISRSSFVWVAAAGFAALGAPPIPSSVEQSVDPNITTSAPVVPTPNRRNPRLVRTARAFNGDLSELFRGSKPVERERPELGRSTADPRMYSAGGLTNNTHPQFRPSHRGLARRHPRAQLFEGLDRFNWGAGKPPDTNGGMVGPTYYIQTVNTSIGNFRKTDGFQVAAFTFDTFMSQGNFETCADTNNFGRSRRSLRHFRGPLDHHGLRVCVKTGPAMLSGQLSMRRRFEKWRPVAAAGNFYSTQLSDALGGLPEVRHLAGRASTCRQTCSASGAGIGLRATRVAFKNRPSAGS